MTQSEYDSLGPGDVIRYPRTCLTATLTRPVAPGDLDFEFGGWWLTVRKADGETYPNIWFKNTILVSQIVKKAVAVVDGMEVI
jgi:hypothetical protein